MASLDELAAFMDEFLSIRSIPDYPNAVNGIQLANIGDINQIATAVDFSLETVTGAINAGAKLLIVHHGMFWGGVQPLTAHRHRRLWLLLTHDVAVYSAHLPLDVHPKIGNNALLAAHIGLTPSGGFAPFESIDVGLSGDSNVSTRELAGKMADFAKANGGHLVTTNFDESRLTRRWGICTGAGASSSTLRDAVERGLDTLIVGEGPHHTAVEANELDIVVMYAGHYSTETLGVRALGNLLAERFGLTATFIEAPTGL